MDSTDSMRIKIRTGVAWRTCKALLGRASIKVLDKHALHVRHATPDLIFIRIVLKEATSEEAIRRSGNKYAHDGMDCLADT